MSRRSRIMATAAVGAGALVAGRAASRRAVRSLEGRPDPHAGEPFGSLRGTPVQVTAPDGTRLYAEIDGADRTDLAVVFCHGWTLAQDTWHFQRRALRGLGRLVFWDQRGHGRSGGGPRSHYAVPRLAGDLAAVIEATVPEDTPIVLIGHSMGGMTIMRFADEYPSLFGSRIVAAGLLNTSSGGLGEVTLGMPAALARLTHLVRPHGLRAAALAAPVMERVRHLARDDARLLVDRLAFGPGAGPTIVALAEEQAADTRLEALIGFIASMTATPEIGTCAAFSQVDTLVIGSENDALTPLDHSLEIVARCPTARLEVVPGAGHMSFQERPALVTDHLADLIQRARKNLPS